jgi:hypothetical protein
MISIGFILSTWKVLGKSERKALNEESGDSAKLKQKPSTVKKKALVKDHIYR